MRQLSSDYVKASVEIYVFWLKLTDQEKPYFAWLMDYRYGFYPHKCTGLDICGGIYYESNLSDKETHMDEQKIVTDAQDIIAEAEAAPAEATVDAPAPEEPVAPAPAPAPAPATPGEFAEVEAPADAAAEAPAA